MSVNEASIQKKFETLQPTQESIETVSLWCLHHKEHHPAIVNVWMKCFKTVPLKQRMSLLYLTNDVCQRERHKKIDVFRKSFSLVLKEAVMIIRAEEIKPNVQRVIDIWKERGIFDDNYINDLKAIINFKAFDVVSPNKPQNLTMTKEAWLSDFKVETVISELEKQKNDAEFIQRAKTLLPPVPFNSDGNIKSYLKDRQEGLKYAKEIDAAHKTLADFVQDLERRLLNKQKLITLLEQTKIFYETQLSEAKIVETAYRKFGSGVDMVKDELENIRVLGLLANGSPAVDAPSPSPNDDPFAQGVEAVAAAKNRHSDSMASIDMELEDESTSKFEVRVATNQSFLSSGQNPFSSPPRKQLILDSQLNQSPVKNATTSSRTSSMTHQLPPPPQPPVQTFHQQQNPASMTPSAHFQSGYGGMQQQHHVSTSSMNHPPPSFFNTAVPPPRLDTSAAQRQLAHAHTPSHQWQQMKPTSGPAILSPQTNLPPPTMFSPRSTNQSAYSVPPPRLQQSQQKHSSPQQQAQIQAAQAQAQAILQAPESPQFVTAASHVTVAADATRLPQPDQIHSQPHFFQMHPSAASTNKNPSSYTRSSSFAGHSGSSAGPVLQPPPPFPVVAHPFGANQESPEAGSGGGSVGRSHSLGSAAATEVEVSLMDEQQTDHFYEEGELPNKNEDEAPPEDEEYYAEFNQYENRQNYRGRSSGANRMNLTVLSGTADKDASLTEKGQRFPSGQQQHQQWSPRYRGRARGRANTHFPGQQWTGGPQGAQQTAPSNQYNYQNSQIGGGAQFNQQHQAEFYYKPRYQTANAVLR